jgi:hypothetical protein
VKLSKKYKGNIENFLMYRGYFMPAISKIVGNGNALKQLLVPVVDSASVSSNLKIQID